MQDIRHESLEAHVLDTGNVLGPLEVVGRPVFPALSGIIDDCTPLLVPVDGC